MSDVEVASQNQRIVLSGLINGIDVAAIAAAVGALQRRHDLVGGEALMELAVDALGLAGVSRAWPLDYSGIREKYLPEVKFSGNTDHQKSHTVLRAVAMAHGGVVPDMAEMVGWWRAEDFWLFALYAVVIYVRAAAERLNQSVADVARSIAERRGIEVGD